MQGVTYLLRELPVSASQYAFGCSKIFIRSLAALDQLEVWRRERIEELVVLIQKLWRGFIARRNWAKLRDSQVVISTYWKRWKDKTHVTELKLRRRTEWAVLLIQKHYRFWQVSHVTEISLRMSVRGLVLVSCRRNRPMSLTCEPRR